MEKEQNVNQMIEILKGNPVLRRAEAYILVVLNRRHRETAFLTDAVRVERDGRIVPLVAVTEPEREVCVPINKNKRELIEGDSLGVVENTHEYKVVKQYPQACIQGYVAYRLNKNGAKLTGFEQDDLHDFPIVYFNAGQMELHVESYEVPGGTYFLSTVDTPCFRRREEKGRPTGKSDDSFQTKYVENGRKGRVNLRRDSMAALLKKYGQSPDEFPEDLIDEPEERFYAQVED